MLQPAYVFNLHQQIQENLVTICKIDGIKPNLVCGTIGGKILIHQPHQKNSSGQAESEVLLLNLNKNITHLTSGNFEQNEQKEILFFASENIIIAYDQEQNTDLFYKDIPDGITAVNFGQMQPNPPFIFVGGNCCIQGFDKNGEEQYWNVASDNISVIAFFDIDEDQITELIMGTEDNYIRIFKNNDIMFEVQEAAKPICIEPLYNSKFAYALENNTIGIYQKTKRLWRVKSKVKPQSLVSMKSTPERSFSVLIIGWQNGRIEVRNEISGEVISKIILNTNLAKMLLYDYRLENNQQIICVTVDGFVKGYTLSDELPKNIIEKQKMDSQSQQQQQSLQGPSIQQKNTYSKGQQQDIGPQLNQINELNKELNSLKIQLHSLQDQEKSSNSSEMALIPAKTKLSFQFVHNYMRKRLELHMKTSTSAIIKGVIIFAEQIFENESYSFFPANPDQQILIPLEFKQNITVDLNIMAFLGTSGNSQAYQIYEKTIKLPKFANLMFIENLQKFQTKQTNSYVQFIVSERLQRFLKWFESCFVINTAEIQRLEKQSQININFLHFPQNLPLQISIEFTSSGANCTFKTEEMELAGDLIQDLAQEMNFTNLESTCDFKEELLEFNDLLQMINEQNAQRAHISGDIAEKIGLVKTLVVKAEDYRTINQLKEMNKMYSNVMIENRNLIQELNQRNSNHAKLVESLKKLSSMINKASNLRFGAVKNKLALLCRTAIKENNMSSLIQLIRFGKIN